MTDVQLADQQLEHLGIDVVLDLQPYGRPADLAPQHLLLQGEQQVLGVVLLDLDVLVAGNPEGVVLNDMHAAEELIEVAGDDVLERDEAALGEQKEPRRTVGTLTRANCRAPVCGLRTSTARLIDSPEM